MLMRQKIVEDTARILRDNLDAEIGIYAMCDENFDALSLPANNPQFDPKAQKIRAINVKCLQQQSTNEATASIDGLMEDVITLQVVIFYASNHENWAKTLNEMCEAVQWTLEFDKEFRKMGQVLSRNTTIDDGTGYTSRVREGGAVIEYSLKIEDTPPATWKPTFDKFKKLGNTFKVSESETVRQTIILPGPWPETTTNKGV